MAYHHVIAKIGTEDKYRCLFSDLSEVALRDRFIGPYEKGLAFFSGNDLISATELRSVRIIRTTRQNDVEREEMNRKDLDHIDDLNRSPSGVFIFSIGGGYAPQDIAEVGDDLTHNLIKGPPGYKADEWSLSKKVIGWVAGIFAAVLAAGIVKYFGWL